MSEQAVERPVAVALERPVRPLYWSIRRELWENRSLYIAPLIVAGVFLFGFALSTPGLPHRRRALLAGNALRQHAVIREPYYAAALLLIVTAFVVGCFYCLDALHGERRDRSILFWKSLPVSDRTTIFAKAAIPMAVLPLITFLTILATQVVLALWTSLVLLAGGVSPASTFQHFSFITDPLVLLYGLVVLALWHAPIYGWLLLVSGWARRATFLWAALPVVAFGIVAKGGFHSNIVGEMLGDRLYRGARPAFDFDRSSAVDSLSQLTPVAFLRTPGLWFGLLFTAAFLAAAIRLRRERDAI